MRLASEGAVHWLAKFAAREGREFDAEFLGTVGIACGLHLETMLRRCVESGMAEADQVAIEDDTEEWEQARQLADRLYQKEPERWAAGGLVMSDTIELIVDYTFGRALAMNATNPPVSNPNLYLAGFTARMAE